MIGKGESERMNESKEKLNENNTLNGGELVRVHELNEIYNKDYLRNRIEDITNEYETTNKLKLVKVTPNQYNAYLEYVGRSLFGGMDTKEDILILGYMVNLYIYFSNLHDKVISFEGYAFICSISMDIVKKWQANEKALPSNVQPLEELLKDVRTLYGEILPSSECVLYYLVYNNTLHCNQYYVNKLAYLYNMVNQTTGLIYRRIANYRESAIKNRLLWGNQQIGALAIANREYRWDADKIAREERARAITLQDLPKITNYVNESQTIEEPKALESP